MRENPHGRALGKAWLQDGFWMKVIPSSLPALVSDEIWVCWEGGFILCLQRSLCDLQGAYFALFRFKFSCWSLPMLVVGSLTFHGALTSLFSLEVPQSKFPLQVLLGAADKGWLLLIQLPLRNVSPNSSHTKHLHLQHWAGSRGVDRLFSMWVSQPLKLMPVQACAAWSKDWWAKGVQQCRGKGKGRAGGLHKSLKFLNSLPVFLFTFKF